MNEGLSDESFAVDSTTTDDTSSEPLMTPISGRTSSPEVKSVEPQEASTTVEPTTSPVGVVGIPVADEAAPATETVSEPDSAPVDEDPLAAIERHLASVANAMVSEEDRLVSQDALLTALSGGLPVTLIDEFYQVFSPILHHGLCMAKPFQTSHQTQSRSFLKINGATNGFSGHRINQFRFHSGPT